ncbi:DUF417 family protein [Sphingobacterium sp.]|uniref:DUF417 family protein n=1 Tax=Sphingobacterium sp. TaxID=341027 RepID=UPI0031E1643C
MRLITQSENAPSPSLPWGFYISTFGIVFILLWLGIFKFTPTEALAIKPLIMHHPLSSWLYRLLSVQAVSNIVGIVEIAVALFILLGLKFKQLRRYAGIGVCIIFIMTLSYLFTTPNMIKYVDGIPVTDFFILKDILFLGFGINLLQSAKK